MPASIARALAVTAVTLAVGAALAPSASAAERRELGNGSLDICFVVPLPGSADISWCL